ncbi:MAG TPA: hypothetical protein VLJ42_02260 [Solirubrobacteraceae bacterium]|nr:hypothetical protein [Solirubrobacteraceae bacterium]
MYTQEQPQLQPPQPPGAAPATTTAYPVYYGQPMPPAAVPPIPPRGKSTGFWVGVTTAIAIGAVAALLVGFFIGRGSRLSNDSVQSKITQQAQSDQISEQQALDAQRTTLSRNQSRAVAAARKSSYSQGRQAGFTAGRQEGFSQGQSQGYTQGQASGTAQGQVEGFSQGLNQGACFANNVFCSGG